MEAAGDLVTMEVDEAQEEGSAKTSAEQTPAPNSMVLILRALAAMLQTETPEKIYLDNAPYPTEAGCVDTLQTHMCGRSYHASAI